MRPHHRLATLVTLLAGSALACGGPPPEDVGSEDADFTIAFPPRLPPVVLINEVVPTVYVSANTDNLTLLGEADGWFQKWFPQDDTVKSGDAHSVDVTSSKFAGPYNTLAPDWWSLRDQMNGLIEMYDALLPIDPGRAETYLRRLHAIASTLLAMRDDRRPPINPIAIHCNDSRCRPVGCDGLELDGYGRPIDWFRRRVMPAWGSTAADQDRHWNTDVLTTSMFMYGMTAFARRVADNPAIQSHATWDQSTTFGTEAIRFVSAAIETYVAFRPELHSTLQPEAYYLFPDTYAELICDDDPDQDHCPAIGPGLCFEHREDAGTKQGFNENLSMMLALSDLALAAASPLLHDSLSNDSISRYWATVDAPLAIVGGVAFFDNNLHAAECEGNPCYTWHNKADGGAPGGLEDSSHGNWEVGLYAAIGERKARLDMLLAANGENESVPIGPDAITRFANTFLHGIVSDVPTGVLITIGDPVYFNGKVDGSGSNTLGGGCDGFTAMTRANPRVWDLCLESSYNFPVTPTHDNEEVKQTGGLLTTANHAALIRYKKDR